jgi:predicted dehydrogenase
MNPSRRSFIKHTAVAGASLPLFSIGKEGASPNEKLNHASFGAAGKAGSDIGMLARTGLVNLVAVAEVDENRLAMVKKNFPKARIYKDWRVLLEKEHGNLDSVNVSTPDHMHAPIAIPAMKLGLHVFGQKPLAHNIYETRRMAEIAKEQKVVTQMGIQLASSTYERIAVKMIQAGVIGKVKEVHIFCHKTWGDSSPRPDLSEPVPEGLDWDLWCGVGPKVPYIGQKYYHPGGWRKRLDYGAGTLGDMGCHLFSPMFRSMGFTAPLSIKSVGDTPNAHNWAPDEKFEYIFAGNELTAGQSIKVIWYDGKHRPPQSVQDLVGGKAPGQGNIFVGTEGALLAPHGELPKPYPIEIFAEYRYPKFPARNHYEDFVNAARGEAILPIAGFTTYGGPLTETVLLGGLASRFPNITLQWDPKTLRVTNLPEANKFVRREYRKGWEVDGLS